MIIRCDLKLTDFEILDFYGMQTCFAWQENRIVTFPFNETEKVSKNLKEITIEEAKEIKSIHNYSGRVFIISKPSGIWKLSQTRLVPLSKTGIRLGAAYREVLVPKDDWLYLDDKADKDSTPLFRLTEPNLNSLLLEAKSTHPQLKKILFPQDSDSDLCILSNGRSLLKLCQKKAQIIYACDSDIVGTVAIKKEAEVSGIAILTNTQSVILAYPSEDNFLIFKKIFLDSNISLLTSAFLQNPQNNEIFIVFAGKDRVNCARLRNGLNTIDDISVVSNSKILSIKSHGNKLFGLSKEGQLNELIINMDVKTDEKKEFHRLNPEMLNGTEVIMDTICERAKELKSVNEMLLIHQDKLNRVNIYAHKQQISHIPKMKVDRTAGRLYLRVIFNTCLPQNSQIVVNLKSQGQCAFSSKIVQGSMTTLEIPLKEEMTDLNISFHLITHSFEAHPWCIIKNCLQDPPKSIDKKNTNDINHKNNFLNAKLGTLRKYIEEETIDMKKLTNIKNILREKFPN